MDFYDLDELRSLAPEKFLSAVSEDYEITRNSLDRLLEDFDLVPRGAYGPRDYESVPLKMREIAERIGLPVKVVGRLQDIGAIGRPITCGDYDFLRAYKITWGNMFLIKTQLAKYSRSQREQILTRPELCSKWEKWVYSLYVNTEIKRGFGDRMINPEKRIRIDDLAEQVEDMFGVPNCHNTRERIKKIREMAYNDKKRGKTERI